MKEVSDRATVRDFHQLPFKIYKDDKNWIPHIKRDIEEVFDKKKNRYFEHGSCIRWVLYNNNKAIGRVAAFINNKTVNHYKQPTGGMGFFECINDRDTAFALFSQCREWLERQGMKAMSGPINFGEKNMYWGLLIEGFDKPAIYQMNHNKEYYLKFFKEYGFTVQYEQIVYYRSAKEPPSPRLKALAERVSRDKSLRVEHIRKDNLVKYANDFRVIYNKAWAAERSDFEELTKEMTLFMMNKLKPVLDEDICWFVYHNDEPSGVYIAIPDLNEGFRYIHGNLNLLGKLKFLWYKKTKGLRTQLGIVFGIVPEYQGKGIEALIFTEMAKMIQPKETYDHILISWIADFNEKMKHLMVALLGVTIYKKYATYIKSFN